MRSHNIDEYAGKPGVYSIYNTATDMMYIGSATNLKNRYKIHCTELKCGRHGNDKMQKAYNKYGANSFEFHIVLVAGPKDDIVEKEQVYMDLCKSYVRHYGYNLKPKARNMSGYRHRAEIKKQISTTLKGRVFSPETKQKLAKASKDYMCSNPEVKQKLIAARLKAGYSEDTRAKMSLAKKNDPNLRQRLKEQGKKLRKLTDSDLIAMKAQRQSGVSLGTLAVCYKVSTRTIANYLNGKRDSILTRKLPEAAA